MTNNIVKLSIPNGNSCMGTKVFLKDGTTIQGVKSLTLRGAASDVWRLELDVMPDFIKQLPIDCELLPINAELSDMNDQQLAKLGLQRIKE